MRIVGGKFANRVLTSPNDFRVRPTAEPVRVAMIQLLGAAVVSARVADLFAGTGALGLEALSHGARTVDFVETRPSSLHALRANIAALRLREKSRVFKRDALPFAAALQTDSYDVAFADPPYGSRMLDRLIETWQANAFATTLVVEHETSHVLPAGAETRTFEETSITLYRA